jgi:hypothetical protein
VKKFLWFTAYVAVGYGAWWAYSQWQDRKVKTALVAGSNQQGGSSVFNEPDLEPVNLAAAATALVA